MIEWGIRDAIRLLGGDGRFLRDEGRADRGRCMGVVVKPDRGCSMMGDRGSGQCGTWVFDWSNMYLYIVLYLLVILRLKCYICDS